MAKKSEATVSEKPKKAYKLDLFRQTLPALFQGKMDFYENCTEDERKEIVPYILARRVSLIKSQQAVAPELVNSFVNIGMNRLKNHPELQWKLLCMVASEISPRVPHYTDQEFFVPKKPKSQTPLLDEYLIRYYPQCNDMELTILKQKLESEANVKDMAEQFGATDAEIKAVVKEYRDVFGKKA